MKFVVESLRLPRISLAVVAQHYEIPLRRFERRSGRGHPAGLSRSGSHVRMLAIWIAKSIGGEGLSYPAIGLALGLNHSSVIHACRQTKKALSEDAELRATVAMLSQRVKAQLPSQSEKPPGAGAVAPEIGEQRANGARDASLAVEASVDGSEPPVDVGPGRAA